MADSGTKSDDTTEATEWVADLTRQKDVEKQVMLEMSSEKEKNPRTSGRYRKLLYFLLLAFAVAIVVLSVKLSTSGGKNEAAPADGAVGGEPKYSESIQLQEELTVPDHGHVNIPDPRQPTPHTTLESDTTPHPPPDPDTTTYPNSDPDTTPDPTPDPDTTPDPTLESDTTQEPTPDPDTTPDPTLGPDTTPDTTLDPDTTTDTALESDTTPDPTLYPGTFPDQTLESDTTPDPTLYPGTSPDPTLESDTTPDPTLESYSTQQQTLDPDSTPDPTVEPDTTLPTVNAALASIDAEISAADIEVCTTEECVLAAAQVLEAVDQTADPCDDFYEYACGQWIKTHTVPADRSYVAPYGLLRDEVSLKLKGILEEDINVNETDTFQNLKKLYRSCVNEELMEKRNASVVYPLLREFGGWPILGDAPGGEWNEDEFDLGRLLLALLKYNNKPLISVWAGRDDLNGTRNIMFIDQPHLGLNMNYFLKPTLNDKLMAYKQLIINTAIMLGADVKTVHDDVNSILELETELAEITVSKEDRRDNTQLYNPLTIAELARNYSNSPSCRDPQFDWLKFLQGAMQLIDEPVDLTEDEEIVLVSLPYYTKLWDVLSNHSPRTISNYIIWRIMFYRIANLPRRFQDEYQKFKEQMYGTSARRDRWRSCTSYAKNVNSAAVGRMFVERYFDDSSKTEADDMIQNIRESFYDDVEELSWMDADMKKEAIQKGENIAVAVGYPENMMNDTVLEEENPLATMDEATYFENVLAVLQEKAKYYLKYLRLINSDERPKWVSSAATVNAFYTPQLNQISFPAGIMQPPYFHVNRPRAMNYGALGNLVGHEITHGFDDGGRQYDKDGNLYNWWTAEADAKFKELAQCIVDQYGAYYWEEAGLNVNGINTQGENIADNGGLKQAYAGYERWKQHNDDDLKLPGMDYTDRQLFFLAYAQTRCSIHRKDGAISHIQSGVHSPNKFRVIGTLRNMPEFAEVFECPVNSGMNPEDKCAVW